MDDMEKLFQLREEMEDLLKKVENPLFLRFFDVSSDELLPQKIEVLKALAEGKTISEIPMFYDVLELYPKDKTHWDY